MYQQVLLEEGLRKYVTINTHKGLYHYNHLPFGVASAPAVSQQLVEQVLQGLPGVACYLDDVLITGRNGQDHLEHLEDVLQRLHDHGLGQSKFDKDFAGPFQGQTFLVIRFKMG